MRVGLVTRKLGKRAVFGAVVLGGAVLAIPQISSAALLPYTVFNDTLSTNGSTINNASQSYMNAATPTSTSTNYDVASSKQATSSALNSGSPLQLIMVSTSSGINEAQGVFTTSPVVLTNIGDAVEITTTFVAQAGLNLNSSSAVYLGLYSSGGNAPYSNMDNGSSSTPGVTGLVNTEVNNNSGGVQNWNGYEADYFGGSSSKLYTRPTQATSTNNADQALVGDGQTGGPSGTQVGTYTSQNSHETTLTATDTYTNELLITLTSAGTYTLSEGLYVGSSDTGTLEGTALADLTVGSLPALPTNAGFDGFAIGYRESDSMASEMDIDSVIVTTTVPEPASLAAVGLGSLLLGVRRRRSR